LIYQFITLILTAICFDILGTRKCQNFKFLTKSRFTTKRTCYTLLNFRKNPTGGVSIEMAEPICLCIVLLLVLHEFAGFVVVFLSLRKILTY
jgi:hypothetical protein